MVNRLIAQYYLNQLKKNKNWVNKINWANGINEKNTV